MKRTLATLVVSAAFAASASGQVGDAQRGIRSVDFRNFTYDGPCIGEGEKKIKVTDGVFHRPDVDDMMYFEVLDVVYGDLTGDGAEEAVVQTNCNTGGTGQFSDGTVFTMRAGKPVSLTTLGIGDRADGGIHDVRIENGVLVVDRYGQENSGACCPEFVETERFRFNGKKFAPVAKPGRRVYLSGSSEPGAAPTRIQFLKGTSSATLVGSTNGNERFVLGARAGQTLEIWFDSKDKEASVRITMASGTRLMTMKAKERWSGLLPESGDFTIAIASPTGQDSSDAYYEMDLSVK